MKTRYFLCYHAAAWREEEDVETELKAKSRSDAREEAKELIKNIKKPVPGFRVPKRFILKEVTVMPIR